VELVERIIFEENDSKMGKFRGFSSLPKKQACDFG